MHTIYERFTVASGNSLEIFKFHSIEALYMILIILLFQKLLIMVNMNSLHYAFRTIVLSLRYMFQIWSTVAGYDETAGRIKPVTTGKIF